MYNRDLIEISEHVPSGGVVKREALFVDLSEGELVIYNLMGSLETLMMSRYIINR